MTYRPDWWPLDPTVPLSHLGVLDIALNLHGVVQGSFELPPEDERLQFEALDWILTNWKEPTTSFDNKVKVLLTTARSEYRSWLAKKPSR